mgnify:CR=1 FL=1
MGRKIGFVAAAAAVFAVVVVIMLNVMSGPLKDSDYLVVGTVATVAAMLEACGATGGLSGPGGSGGAFTVSLANFSAITTMFF